MNWLTALFSGGDAVKVVGDTVEKLFTNDDAREKELELQKAQFDYNLEEDKLTVQLSTNQTDINKVEAANSNLFVAGARPAILWICGFAFAYSAIFEPIARFIAKVVFDYNGDFPVIDTTMTGQILMGILGLGTLRTIEKSKGVS